jgi:hypothetical protein
MPGIRALIMTVWPRVMGGTTRGKSPMPSSFGASGYDTKRTQPSRSEIGNDKDWIPLVETVTVPEKSGALPPAGGVEVVSSVNVDEEKVVGKAGGWPLGGGNRTSGGVWNEPASWESSRAPHTRRATLERRNSAGGRWKISMDAGGGR